MAVNFSGSGEYWANASYSQPSYPFTMACWFRCDQVTSYDVVFALSDATVDDFSIGMAGNVGGDPLYVLARQVSSVASFGGTVPISTWVSGIAVFRSTTSRTGFLNGSSVGENTTSIAPSTTDIRIGGTSRSGANDFDGQIAESAIWSGERTQAEIDALAAGASPALIAPHALLDYWPMWTASHVRSIAGRATTLTATGTSTYQHPRIVYPWSPTAVTRNAAAAPSGFQSAWAARSTVTIQPGMVV